MAALKKIARQIFSPLQAFIQDSRSTGILLLCCTVISMVIANTGAGTAYFRLLDTGFHYPNWLHLPHTLLHWINDGAMALFFFLVGMEIKRELLSGELADIKKALLPVGAAAGGMLVPALLFLLFNHNNAFTSGWGIPMATDIAFSLGILSILGARIPLSLKIFLMALAIIDDLGAIVVIAVFYSENIQLFYLLLSGGIVAGMAILYWLKWLHPFIALIAGIALWYTVFNSGIHPTVAGVVAALFVPVDKLSHYEHTLHGLVNFIVLPLFALANTAIVLPADIGGTLTGSLSIGIIIGLVAGKPIGIVLFSWLMVKCKLGAKPSGSTWSQMVGIGALAGIGFTMSIFIALLAFPGLPAADIAKLAVLAASLLAATTGIVILRNRG